MIDDRPPPLDLLAASIREDPDGWIPAEDEALTSEQTSDLVERIVRRGASTAPTTAVRERGHEAHWSSRPRFAFAAMAAVTLAACAVGASILWIDAPTAHAEVSDAAAALGEVHSLEGERLITSPDVVGRSAIAVSGSDYQVRSEAIYADGHVEASDRTVIGDRVFESSGDGTEVSTIEQPQRNAPFGEASAAVVKAATTGAAVTRSGSAEVDGIASTRYEVAVGGKATDALAELPPSVLAWFDLENPERVESMTLWVADGIIHQVELASQVATTRTRFFNFNGDVEIAKPEGF